MVADLRTQVHNYGSRGLMSIVAHPSFPAQPYVYVYYTLDAPIGGTPPVYGGGTRLFDGCPKYDSDGDSVADLDNCPVGSRVSRLTIAGETMSSEQVLVEDYCQQFAGARRRRPRLRRGRQPVRERQRRLHGAVLGLRPEGLPGQPVRRPAGRCRREPHASDLRGWPPAGAGPAHHRLTRPVSPAR